jgi:protein-tyrosine phosphatase
MYEIIPNLYLSAYHEIENITPETFIVNCTKDLPMIHINGIRIPVDDDLSKKSLNDMFIAFPEIVEKIDEQLKKNNKVVVHCMAGQQRSPAVIVAYLIAKKNFTLFDAIIYVREKRKEAFFWQINFKDSLEYYEIMLKS